MKLKGIVFVNKNDQIIPLPLETETEGYEAAHEMFKRSNIDYYMFLLKPEVKEKVKGE
jgi:hypothetical protein